MTDVFRRIGEKAKDLGEKARETTREVTKRPSELFEVTKLKLELSKLEKERENNLSGIGTLIYQKHRGKENLDEEIERLCQQTRALEEEKAKIKEKISSLQPQPRTLTCPDCKRELPPEGIYCNYCGKKISK